jgi:hypothetical protein
MRTRIIGAALAAVTLAACNEKALEITNPNNPTVTAAAGDPAALQLLATGLLADYRGSRTGFIQNTAIFGREAYNYFPTDPRFTQHALIGIVINGITQIDPSGFYNGLWAPEYTAMRDLYNFRSAVTANAGLTDAQKNAALGFAKTIEAAELLEVVATRDTIGAITQIKENAADLAPFVSRDSVYKYILGTLDESLAKLGAGGAAFPFTLHPGFNGFNTPATFAQFTQALKARAESYYATSGGGAAAWQATLTALAASFLNPAGTSRAALDVGPAHVYSAASGDVANSLNATTNADLYAHMSILTDVQKKADGTNDNRYTAKLRTAPLRNAPQNLGLPSSLGFAIWSGVTSPVAIIRNEELIAIRAEARLATGDKAGAIADLNVLRTQSGGLPASTLTAANTPDEILTGLLFEKRYSTLMEGLRWVDMRRYGRLSQLPLDITSGTNKHFVAKVMPVPQAECLSRAGQTGSLAGPGCQ